MIEQFVARTPRHAVRPVPSPLAAPRPARALAMGAVAAISLASWVAIGHAVGLI